ncbi:MAG TPA: hypothetical protein VGW77_01960 [Candidatus Binatia bacterium]|jgi:hypothetical protein|nr:hypothetical protein [Candidatus Binatia bacterium]
MEIAKFLNFVLVAAHAEPELSEPTDTKPVSESVEQIELDALLEELAELIESEDGILIP